jgi:hypothetical protein
VAWNIRNYRYVGDVSIVHACRPAELELDIPSSEKEENGMHLHTTLDAAPHVVADTFSNFKKKTFEVIF